MIFDQSLSGNLPLSYLKRYVFGHGVRFHSIPPFMNDSCSFQIQPNRPYPIQQTAHSNDTFQLFLKSWVSKKSHAFWFGFFPVCFLNCPLQCRPVLIPFCFCCWPWNRCCPRWSAIELVILLLHLMISFSEEFRKSFLQEEIWQM
jgi:hypothetical protein